MKKTLLAATVAACAFTAMPAFAQSTQFVTQQPQSEWRGSKLMGLDVYGTDNQKIGDVRDILVDRNGDAKTIVIGVGGFLGIGEKDVAVPFKSLQFSDQPMRSSASASATGGGAANSNATHSGAGTAANPTSTASTATNTTGTGSSASSSSSASANAGNSTANRGYPDHAVLAMTKDQLQNAPKFTYAGSSSSGNATTSHPATTTGTGPATGGGAGTAPRQ